MESLKQHLDDAHDAVGRLWDNKHDGYQQYEINECDCDLCEADQAAKKTLAGLWEVDTDLRQIVLNLDREHHNNPPENIQEIIDEINRIRDRLTGR